MPEPTSRIPLHMRLTRSSGTDARTFGGTFIQVPMHLHTGENPRPVDWTIPTADAYRLMDILRLLLTPEKGT